MARMQGWSWDAGEGEAGPHLHLCLSFLTPTAPYDHAPGHGDPMEVAMTEHFGVETPPFGSRVLPTHRGASSQAKHKFLTYFSLSFAAKKFIFHGR